MFDAFGNSTQANPTKWRDEPNTRGTWSILSSCLVTLGLCLWTALHLNIPRHKEGFWGPKMRKAAWLLLGLLAPETLAYTAWYQRRAARQLHAFVKEKLDQNSGHTTSGRIAAFFRRTCCLVTRNKDGESSDLDLEDFASRSMCQRHQWTITHSFYALMGGFAFDIGHTSMKFLPGSRQRLTLTPRGLLYILEEDPSLLPDISEEHIRDKSKASTMAKTLVCLQAFWFCSQVVVRVAQGLAVSLLELNVFGHAICALLMYCLWWNKPMDIEEPTIITGSNADEMCALMCMRSSRGDSVPELPHGVPYGLGPTQNIAAATVRPSEDHQKHGWYRIDKPISDFLRSSQSRLPKDYLGCKIEWTMDCPTTAASSDIVHYARIEVEQEDTVAKVSFEATTASGIIADPPRSVNSQEQEDRISNHMASNDQFSIHGFHVILGRRKGLVEFIPFEAHHLPNSVQLTGADSERWRLCAAALRRYCPQPRRVVFGESYSTTIFPAKDSVYERAPNWPTSEDLVFTQEGEDQGVMISAGFSLAGFAYGGLHLLAWSAPFPTYTENVLWKVAGITIISSGLFYILVYVSGWINDWSQESIKDSSLWRKFTTFKAPALWKYVEDPLALLWIGIAFLLLCSFCVLYVGARGYLVAESFLQLAHLPDSVYALPTWPQYLPHIT